MRDPENIRKLVALQPDFIGFILYPESKRYVGDNYILETEIPSKIKRTGVFVNALLHDVVHWVNRLKLDYVQLHGNESVEYCQELTEMKIPVIKTFGMHDSFDFNTLQTYEGYCDFFLFDTTSPEHGGSGKKFNWNLLNAYTLIKPIILSGGIGLDDLITVLSLSEKIPLHAIDINSRFENAPGIKDIKMIKEFIGSIKKHTLNKKEKK